MAQTDRRIPQLTTNKEGKVSVAALNEIIRQIFVAINRLEGRSGPVEVKDSVTIKGNLHVTKSITIDGLPTK